MIENAIIVIAFFTIHVQFFYSYHRCVLIASTVMIRMIPQKQRISAQSSVQFQCFCDSPLFLPRYR